MAEATLRLKRATLHAEERSEKMDHSIKEVSLDIRRQVKRHRELRRKRTDDAPADGADAQPRGLSRLPHRQRPAAGREAAERRTGRSVL